MVEVLVTHSYHLPYDAKQLRKMQPYVPLATLYAASALRESGISVAAFDSMLQNPDEKFGRYLEEKRPRIVVVYEDDLNFLSKMCLTRMREVAWGIANSAQAIGAVTIVHGSDSTDNPQLFLESGFDFVCCGESEDTLVQLCMSILRGEEPPEIDGLVRLNVRGKLNRSPQRLAQNPRWTELPFPARELIDLEPYRNAWIKAHGHFSTNMVSSRGCRTDSDDLCIMYNGAYTTDLYRAVGDALHAEVDSWSKPRLAREPLNDLEALWNCVSELEPDCRNASSFNLAEQKPAFSTSEFVPVDKLVAARGF